MKNLPLISFPITIAIVDDDSLMLDSLTELLKNNYALIKFQEPNKCANFFENYKPLSINLKLLQGCNELENYNISGHLPADIDFSELAKFRENKERLNEMGVLIVDYNMPGMTGIELCRKLQALPIKKILLTGEPSEKLAISAFNEGIINCYIRKDSPTIASDIKGYLESLTKEYLSNITLHLLKHLEADCLLPISDPLFINFFINWCSENNICEYYIIDQNSTFLLIDKNGKRSYFVTNTDRTLKNLIDMHEDNNEASALLTIIKSKKKIPFFGEDKESWDIDIKDWEKYLYVPTILEGREKYYWGVLSL